MSEGYKGKSVHFVYLCFFERMYLCVNGENVHDEFAITVA